LVWGEALPWWVSYGKHDSSQLKKILHDHVTTVVKRYKGKIAEWDVLNEPMEDDVDATGSRHSIWRDVAFKGDFDNYVHTIFKWAKETDPQALMCLNEYGVDIPTRKADALFKVVKKHVQKLGTPIDCIGLQNHYDPSDELPSVNEVLSQIRRYNKIGIDVRISELDKDIEDHVDKKHLEHQAKYFVNVLKACMLAREQSNTKKDSQTKGRKQGTCIGYAFWGFTDKYSSLAWGTKSDEIGHGMILDEHYKPKPGYTAIYNYLKSYH
jgi:endo-1,4-beta-xylanase